MRFTEFQSGLTMSPEDERDYTLEKVGVLSSPVIHEYRLPYVAPVTRQDGNKCLAFTLASIIAEWCYLNTKVYTPLSADWIYNLRTADQQLGEGMMAVTGLKNATRFGVPRLSLFKQGEAFKVIPEEVVAELLPDSIGRCIKGFVRLRSIADVLTALKKFNTGVVLGLLLTESFFNTGKNGIVPPPSGKNIGGHALEIVGTKNINGAWHVEIKNTWGEEFGDRGFCYLDLSLHKGFELWGVYMISLMQKTKETQQMLMKVGADEFWVDTALVKVPLGFRYMKAANGETKLMGPVRELFEMWGSTSVKWYKVGNDDYVHIKRGGQYEMEDIK